MFQSKTQRRSLMRIGAATGVAVAAVIAFGSAAGAFVPPPDQMPDLTTPEAIAEAQALIPDDAALLANALYGLGVGSAVDADTGVNLGPPADVVEQCFADAGFEYFPVPLVEEIIASRPGAGMSPADYAAQYGFGQATGFLDDVTNPAPPDAQQEYLASLSPAEAEAYYRAGLKCAVSSPGQILYMLAYSYAYTQWRGAVLSDQGYIDATQAWTDCISAAGYDFASPEDMRSAYFESAYEASELGVEALQDAVTAEIAAAVTNVPCEAAYREVVIAVATEHFNELHQVLLDAIANGLPQEATEAAG